MVLARAVKNPDGQVLLKEGIELSGRLIERLGEWECDLIYVEGEPESPEEEEHVVGLNIKNADIQDILVQIELRFSNVRDDELMQKIKRGVQEHYIRKYYDGRKTDDTQCSE